MNIQVSVEGNIVKVTQDGSFVLGFDHPWSAGAAQTLAIVIGQAVRAAVADSPVTITYPTGVVESVNEPEPESEEDEVDGLVVFQMFKDEGTVVLFDCYDADQRLVRIAVDHRLAEDIREVLHEDGEVPVIVEPWQIVARF